MKLRNLVGDRFKERPSDCVIDSHALMVRGGYMKYVANGIYSSYPPLKRILKKIEQIIREEMDGIDGQEVQFPVALPGSLWEESGRMNSVGSELIRFKDRNGSSMVLGMTHEEVAVQMVREYAQSYVKYPFMIYQIQTKFRDEARPRAGLIRVREFTMKDAYSFHTSQKDLEAYYEKCYHAYERIFARTGIPEVITVASDSGMMGGNISHEFMLLTPIGEDSIAICTDCDYKANLEAAVSVIHNSNTHPSEEIQLVHTPNASTIEEVAVFLNIPVENTCKAVVYQTNLTDEYVIVFIRGDLDINETKLTKHLKEEIHPALITEESGLNDGYIGPYKLSGQFIVLFDLSLQNISNLACGGNQEGYHYLGFQIERDYGSVDYLDLAKIKEGGICPKCGRHSITISRGIEVGNIFQLGIKYSKAMNMQYSDKDGNLQNPIMGCYGIGVGRLAASVCEARHDDYGPIWPITIAPWQVHLCCLRADDEHAKACADSIYETLLKEKIEVLYDERNVRPGVMFSDADLFGIPIRVIVSPRNVGEGIVEIITRDKSINKRVTILEITTAINELLAMLTADLEGLTSALE
ncbi:MAG: proline--tRNA ligase [Herbinix sp.]|nr:proline--tRNA ligase [Herbinix sp.]